MKRLLLAICCLMVMASPAAAVATFDFVALGNITPGTNGPIWTTNPDINRYVLGISTEPGGPLIPLDAGGGLTPPLTIGNIYYLYAGNLGSTNLSNIRLDIYADHTLGGGSPEIYCDFDVPVPSTPGTFQLWNPNHGRFGATGGLPPTDIYLGWAQGTADLVGLRSNNDRSPDGTNDYYFVLGIGVEPTPPSTVPIPGALLLFGSGLLGLIGIGRRRFRM